MSNYRRLKLQGHCYFFTVVTYQRRQIFNSDEAVALLTEVIANVQSKWPFETVAHVSLPDHLHVLWQLPEIDADFSTRWMLIKSNFSRRFAKSAVSPDPRPDSRTKKREQTVWQRRFWEHAIRDQRDLDRHTDYIHFNPVRHGLVSNPEDWPFSSYHQYYCDSAPKRLVPAEIDWIELSEPYQPDTP